MNNQWLEPNFIPPVEITCEGDIFENMIREMGVGYSCEWFGYDFDSDFSRETVNVLCERSGIDKPFDLGED